MRHQPRSRHCVPPWASLQRARTVGGGGGGASGRRRPLQPLKAAAAGTIVQAAQRLYRGMSQAGRAHVLLLHVGLARLAPALASARALLPAGAAPPTARPAGAHCGAPWRSGTRVRRERSFVCKWGELAPPRRLRSPLHRPASLAACERMGGRRISRAAGPLPTRREPAAVREGRLGTWGVGGGGLPLACPPCAHGSTPPALTSV